MAHSPSMRVGVTCSIVTRILTFFCRNWKINVLKLWWHYCTSWSMCMCVQQKAHFYVSFNWSWLTVKISLSRYFQRILSRYLYNMWYFGIISSSLPHILTLLGRRQDHFALTCPARLNTRSHGTELCCLLVETIVDMDPDLWLPLLYTDN